MERLQHIKEYSVHVYETGPDGKLNLHSLCNYFQDIASDHAVLLGFGKEDLEKENRFWVLSRLAISINDWPGWSEKVIVRTWTRGTDKLFALRDFEVSSPDGKILAAASSSWLMLDLTTKRIQRPDHLAHFNSDGEIASALKRNAAKIDPVAGKSTRNGISRVAISELDVNLHVNNAVYVKWATDMYDLDFRLSYRPVSAEINFLAESRLGDDIFVETAKVSNEDIYKHSVYRNDDNTELCRLMIGWKNCSH